MSYFLTFRARGEVAEMLLLGGPEPRLLVDLSVEPVFDDKGLRRHTERASFTITDPELIRRFMAEMSLGDVAEAEGAFRQGDYTPHRTSCIDTIFTMQDFRRIARPARAPKVPRAAANGAAANGAADTLPALRPAAAVLLH